MLMIETSKKFDKDLKKLVKNGFDLKLLYQVVENLAKEQRSKNTKTTRSKAV